MRAIIYLFAIFFVSFYKNVCTLEVTIEQGNLFGKEFESRNKTKFYGFLGIPYAKPPVGSYRFKPPHPPRSWKGTRVATQYKSVCPQVIIRKKPPFLLSLGDEDCLYVNVYTPKIDKDAKLPVMIWIHGGGFSVGGGSEISPVYLMDEPIVFVSFNYRLGILGFLSTGDKVVPGNNGAKDQVAALKWVQKNIDVFGGDPDRVTLFGNGAGAISVHSHTYSPLSKGLFSGIISQSGSILGPWSFIPSYTAKNRSRFVGILMDCDYYETKLMVKCLKEKPAEDFPLTLQKFYKPNQIPIYPFGIINEVLNAENPFLTSNPWYNQQKSDIPAIMGVTSDDGDIYARFFLNNKGALLPHLQERYEFLFPEMLNFDQLISDQKKKHELSKKIKEFYFDTQNISIENYRSLIKLFTDAFYVRPAIDAAFLNKQVTYFYKYLHRNKHSFTDIYLDNSSFQIQASHYDELVSLFHIPSLFPKIAEGKDLAVSKKLIRYWVNFAYYKNPNGPDNSIWKPLSDTYPYLEIGTKEDRLMDNIFSKAYIFWKNLYTFLSSV